MKAALTVNAHKDQGVLQGWERDEKKLKGRVGLNTARLRGMDMVYGKARTRVGITRMRQRELLPAAC